MCIGEGDEIQIRLTKDASLIIKTLYLPKHENIAAITMF
jgi:hypothetical protein